MKVAQVAVYLDAEQARFIREDARRAISTQRDIYAEIVSKLEEAEKKLNCGEYELRESD